MSFASWGPSNSLCAERLAVMGVSITLESWLN